MNGESVAVNPGAATLLDVLREDLDLTGAKKACDNGECGSCIVLMRGKPTKACLLPARRAADKDIVTIEGLAPGARGLKAEDDLSVLHPLQQAFLVKGATQCGFCIPGMILKAHSLLRSKPDPTRAEIVKSLSKNLCRCTGYTKIIEAVEYAAELIRSGESAAEPPRANGHAVGVSVARLDSPSTVNGAAKYGADLKMEGMLHAKLLRSRHHHARILSIDVSEAAAMPGVEAVVTADDVPGTPYLPNCQPQVFVFPRDRIRFKGEALAGVAAVSEEIAAAALRKIRVEVEVLPHAVEIDEAADPSATPLYDHSPRVSPPEEVSCGDVEKGFAEADVIVEGEYTVPVREHAAMEPESALAFEENGQVVIRTGLYHAFVQGTESIANNLGLSPDEVRIVCPAMGGNFGTRGDTLIAVASALLARKTGRPVKMVFSREESILGSCKAPSVNMRYRTGATRDGRIVALDVEIMHGTGSWAPFLIDRTTRGVELCYYETLGALLSHVTGPYEIGNVRARGRDVLTNGPRYVPLRGTNANYLPLAYESQVDLVAERLGLNPIDVRLRNAIRTGSRTHFGQHLTDSVSMVKELEVLRPHYEAARKRLERRRAGAAGAWRPGLGVGCGWRNIGYFKSTISAGCELDADGTVHVMAGTVEQGQGPTTQFAQIAADAVGVPMNALAGDPGRYHRRTLPGPDVQLDFDGGHRQGGADGGGEAASEDSPRRGRAAPVGCGPGDDQRVPGAPRLGPRDGGLSRRGRATLRRARTLEPLGSRPRMERRGADDSLRLQRRAHRAGREHRHRAGTAAQPRERLRPRHPGQSARGRGADRRRRRVRGGVRPVRALSSRRSGDARGLRTALDRGRTGFGDPALCRGPAGTRAVRGEEHGGASRDLGDPRHRRRDCQRHRRQGTRHSGHAGSDQGRARGPGHRLKRAPARPSRRSGHSRRTPMRVGAATSQGRTVMKNFDTRRKRLSRRTFVKQTGAAAGAVALFGGQAPAFAAGKHKLRYIAFINRNTVWGKPYDFLAQEVDRMSGGELEIEYAGGSDVIGGFDAPEAVANGVFDMSHSANAYFAGAMPSSISLASGSASVDALRESGAIDAYADILMKQRGVMLLGTPLTGVGYVFQVRGRPDTLAYFKGKKIRSIPLYDPILQALGATPVTTSPAEAYTAMERGVVDGLGWPDIGLLDFKFYEQAKYIMAPTFYSLRTVTLLNPNSYKRLPAPLQDILVEASRSADAIGAQWAKEKRAAEHAEMEKHGVEIVSLSDAESKQFVDLTEEKLWAKIHELAPEDADRLRPLFEKAG